MSRIKAGRDTGFGAGVLIIAATSGQALFIKRSAYGDFPGHWCCPGGGVEDNETIEQAVRRETMEEIGYNLVADLQHMDRSNKDGFVFCNHVALVPEPFVPVLNKEHTDYKWSDEFPSPMHPGLKEAIEAMVRRIDATASR